MEWKQGTSCRVASLVFKTPDTPLYRCTKCSQDKPRELFSSQRRTTKAGVVIHRRSSWCRKCESIAAMERRHVKVAKAHRAKYALERLGVK